MQLLDGLHAIRLRRLRADQGIQDIISMRTDEGAYSVYAHTYDALAWQPGTEADAMWRAHTEAVFGEQWRERLTRSG